MQLVTAGLTLCTLYSCRCLVIVLICLSRFSLLPLSRVLETFGVRQEFVLNGMPVCCRVPYTHTHTHSHTHSHLTPTGNPLGILLQTQRQCLNNPGSYTGAVMQQCYSQHICILTPMKNPHIEKISH